MARSEAISASFVVPPVRLHLTKSCAKGRPMPDMTPAPRRRPLWRLFIMPALVVVAAIAWSGFWFYAASEAGVRADAWTAQEAKAGRVYQCGSRSVAGYPFRLEVRCDDASVSLGWQTPGGPTPSPRRAGHI